MTQLTRIGKLSYPDILSSIQNFLSQQSTFTDYDMQGSGMFQLVSTLAYNSHYDALEANLIANEVFLDTAIKRSSVTSHAKSKGYSTTSPRASNTSITLKVQNTIDDVNLTTILVPQNTIFQTSVGNASYNFLTKTATVLTKAYLNAIPYFTGSVTAYEGMLVQQTFTYSSVNPIIKLNTLDVDTTSISVQVLGNVSNAQWQSFNNVADFISVTSTTKAYFVQEGFNGYEIYFGDGNIGVIPVDGAIIKVQYIVTSGSIANGAKVFNIISTLPDATSNTSINLTSTQSSGGSDIESIQSIKFNAPNLYSAQNRCVNSSDYAVTAIKNFPQTIQHVIGWDGSDNVPPLYAKTVLCALPTYGDVLTKNDKTTIAAFLKTKAVGNINVVWVDPQIVNVVVNSTVKYDKNILTNGTFSLEYSVIAAITSYAANNINTFNSQFLFSPLLKIIDDSDPSIISNYTTVSLIYNPLVNLMSVNNIKFSFGNPIIPKSMISIGYFDSTSNYMLFLQDDGVGNISSYYNSKGVFILYKNNLGTIDYNTGNVQINNFTINSYTTNAFDIKATPTTDDIKSSNNIILRLLQEDISVTPIAI